MIVNFNGEIFSISFSYGKITIEEKDGHQVEAFEMIKRTTLNDKPYIEGEITTICTIEKRLDKANYELVSHGFAKKSPVDKFDCIIGRKLSLMRALQNAGERGGNLDFRKTVWNKYFDSHKDGKEIVRAA